MYTEIKKPLSLLILLLLVSCGATEETMQINLHTDSSEMEIKWNVSDFPLDIYVSETDFPDNSLDKAALEGAINTWNSNFGISIFSLSYISFSASQNVDSMLNDSTITTSRSDSDEIVSTSALAVTYTNYINSTGKIVTGDIFFSSIYNYGSYTGTGGYVQEFDLESIYFHELGHLIGLVHVSESEDSSSFMNPSLNPYQVKNTFTEGDLLRISEHYPDL